MSLRSGIFICAAMAIALGASVITGWVLEIPTLIQVIPGLVGMVFNTALCFIMTGFLLLSYYSIPTKNLGQIFLSIIIIIYASISLTQNLFAVDLGIDRIFVNVWLQDPNPNPGRMAPNTSLAFILTGIAAILIPYGHKKALAVLTQLIVFSIFIIALTGLLIYSLKLEFIFSWYTYTRMAMTTAFGFLIVSVGLWLIMRCYAWYIEFYKHSDRRITITIGALLISLTLISGVGSVAGLTYFNIKAIQKEFQTSLLTKTTIFEKNIKNALDEVKAISQNSNLVDFLETNHSVNTNQYDKLIDTLFFRGFSAIEITNNAGKVVLSLGSFVPQSELAFNLSLPENPVIFFKDQSFWLKSHVPILNAKNQQIGMINSETPLTDMNLEYKHYNVFGTSGEINVCALQDKNTARCFPTSATPHVFDTQLTQHGMSAPIFYALQGKTGALDTAYRNQKIIAAFSPINNTGLGMVVKIDAMQIYQPLSKQLQIIMPVVLFLMICGFVLLHWQVSPLVTKVVLSEKAANESRLELQKSENRYAIAVSAGQTGLWDWKIGTDEVYFSPQFKNLLGYFEDEFADSFQAFENALHPEDRIRVQNLINEHLEYDIPYNIEYRLKLKSGQYHWFQSIGQVVRDDEGHPIHMAGSLLDISERKAVETMKNEFISVVSHELRTPLTSIHGSVSLLVDDLKNQISADSMSLLEIAKSNTERLIRLINDILDVEKIESGKMEFQLEVLPIAKLIIDAVTDNLGFAEKFNVKINIKNPDTPVKVNVDRDRLLQVLTNLISNAIKFSPENSEVTVGYKLEPHNVVRVTVSDKGKGIPDEFKARIFQKFSQADSSSTRNYQGTGLGLNISKSIIDNLGGTIGFISAENQGTIFYFDLPVWVEETV